MGDAGLAHIAGLSRIHSLYLLNTGVTDAGLRHLSGLGGLSEVYLDGTKVTDDGIKHLAGLPSLKWLHVKRTGVSAAGAGAVESASESSGGPLMALKSGCDRAG